MPSGFNQLVAVGPADVFLIGNPQTTFFKAVYKRYTNFSVENIHQLFTGDADFGKKVICKLDRHGDLIHRTYLHVELPQLPNSDVGNPQEAVDVTNNSVKYYWINGVGNALIQKVDVYIGGNLIDRHYGLWMEIWNELTIPLDHKAAYNEMVGKTDPVFYPTDNNSGPLKLYIPLIFWFNRNVGLSLPLISLQYSEVEIQCTFRLAEQLMISNTGVVMTQDELNCIHIQKAELLVDYIYLGDDERRYFAKNEQSYLIEQLQLHSETIPTVNETNKNLINLYFNLPVKELVWVIQNESITDITPYGGNEWFNFSSLPYLNGRQVGGDPLIKAKILFEGNERQQMRDAEYYRLVLPFQYHTYAPSNNFIYLQPLCLEPENINPTGSCNFSAIDNKQLYLETIPAMLNPIINIFAVNYNILKICNGLAGLVFSN